MEEQRDLADELFTAMQTLIDGSLSSLNYDETITCRIVNIDNQSRGEYIVDDGSSTFVAYSEITTYTLDTEVYVTIPQGDYNNKKIILGRRTSEDTEYFNYVAPTQTYVDITNNLITKSNLESSILANGDQIIVGPIYTLEGSYKGYDRMGLKAKFKTLLNGFSTISGSYGLYLKVFYYDQELGQTTDINNNPELKNVIYRLTEKDMYGNVYNFNTFFEQEAVFDISDLGEIKKIEIYLYQSKDFKSKIALNEDEADEYIPHQEIMQDNFPSQSKSTNFEDNIFVKDLYLSFGYDLNNFNEDKVIVYTLDNMTYASEDSQESRKRNLQARWVHKCDDGSIISVGNSQELPEYNAQIFWHRYNLDEETNSEYGGKYWGQIEANASNLMICDVICRTDVQDEHYKVCIIVPAKERYEVIRNFKETYSNQEKWVQSASSGSSGIDIEYEKTKALKDSFDAYLETHNIDVVSEAFQNFIESLTELNKNEDIIKAQKEVLENDFKIWTELPNHNSYEEEIQIHNNTMVQASLAIDLVQAIEISVEDEDGRNGIYNIYGDDGNIMNRNMSLSRHKLKLSYNSILTGLEDFDGDGTEIVTWKIPIKNTMIQEPVEKIGFSYNDTENEAEKNVLKNANGEVVLDAEGKTQPIYKKDDSYAYIKKVIEKSENDNTEIGGYSCKTNELLFRIKEYYTAGGNNTISCIVEKGGYHYPAEITLVFGTAGTNGTDYTFVLETDKNAFHTYKNNTLSNSAKADNENFQISITPKVYDYNNQEVEITSIKYYAVDEKGSYKQIDNNKFVESNILTLKDLNNTDTSIEDLNYNWKYKLIKVISNIKNASVGLTQYISLPWTKNLENYNHIQGPNKIVYNSQGVNPAFYKGDLKLYNYLDVEVKGVKWEIINSEDDEKNKGKQEQDFTYENAKYYPSVEVTTDGYSRLRVPSAYIKGIKNCSLIAKINNEIVWCQPLNIMQNAYDSALLNSWNGNLSIDEENNTIMTQMLGAGRKNQDDNSFSGVLIGDISMSNDKANLTGVYGYDRGIQSFSLTEDGVATFGASGKGQIVVNGNKGTITSGNYVIDQDGMEINLEHGSINSYNYSLRSKNISMTSRDPYTIIPIETQEEFDSYKNTIDLYQKTGTTNTKIQYKKIADDAVFNSTKTYYTLSSTSTITYLALYSDVGNTLMNIGNEDMYLQTDDYNITERTGIKLDLAKGKFNAYEFDLQSNNIIMKSSGLYTVATVTDAADFSNKKNTLYTKLNNNYISVTDSDTYDSNEQYYVVNSNNNDYLTIKSATNNTLMNIGNKNMYLQTDDYNTTERTGIKLDLAKGKFNAYEFDLQSNNIIMKSSGLYTVATVTDAADFSNKKNTLYTKLNNNYISVTDSDTYDSNEQYYVVNSNNNDYLTIKSATNNTLMNIGNKNMYLQTDDYNTTERTGIKLDLAKGKFNAYEFDLESHNIILNSKDAYKTVTISDNIDFNSKKDTLYTKTGKDYNQVESTATYCSSTKYYMEDTSSVNYLQIKSNSGTVLMNMGNKSMFIRSNNYSSDSETGINLDLLNGKFDVNALTLKSPNIYLNTHKTDFAVKTLSDSDDFEANKANLYIRDTDGNYVDKNGNKYNLVDDNATYNSSQTYYSPENNIYFQIKSNTQKKLLVVGDDDLYLQTNDYNTDNKTGMRFDLDKGKITAYDFTLDSANIQINSQINNFVEKTIADDAEFEENKESLYTKSNDVYTILESTATYNANKKYFTPKNGVYFTIKSNNDKKLMVVGDKQMYLQTANFQREDFNENASVEGQGLKFDLANGKLEAYDFSLDAVKTNLKLYSNIQDALDKEQDDGIAETTNNNSDYYIADGELQIRTDSSQFPLQLKVRVHKTNEAGQITGYSYETPFRLSWAGYLVTNRIKATGGTIGGWAIEENALTSDGKNIMLVNGTGEDKSYISIGIGKDNATRVFKLYPASSVGNNITNANESHYSDSDIGKYVNSDKEGYYRKIVSLRSPYYETTYQIANENLVGGVYFDSSGYAKITNLELEGGSGYWGGTAAYANYSYSTYADGHTHTLSGTQNDIELVAPNTTLYIRGGGNTNHFYTATGFKCTVSYNGNSKTGLTLTGGNLAINGQSDYGDLYSQSYIDNYPLNITGSSNSVTCYNYSGKVIDLNEPMYNCRVSVTVTGTLANPKVSIT